VIQRKIGEGKIIKIKWINDVLVDFEKVAGVLVRGEIQGNRFIAEIGTVCR
jgi:biotin-(acetyl-CoA carboxylase) ligase